VVEGRQGQEMSLLRANFPFPNLREKQSFVLDEIASALSSGFKFIILEAPTGFGKSPIAIASAMALGSSYICTSTKNLQTQYAKDFPFIKTAKGKSNFQCEVKEDFIKAGKYRCKGCSNAKRTSHPLFAFENQSSSLIHRCLLMSELTLQLMEVMVFQL
jgi:ATP-dependent DNA helicase DinG